jgi:hypothetical protein
MSNYRTLTLHEPTRAGDEYNIPLEERHWFPVLKYDVGKTQLEINAQTPEIPNRLLSIRRPLPMKVVYVAGPFRGPSAWDIECNIRRAETLALEVWRLGAAALCPHCNTRFFQNAAPDEVWLKGDLELLRRCDAIIVTEDWERSSGARAEVDFAVKHSIPFFATLSQLQVWLGVMKHLT